MIEASSFFQKKLAKKKKPRGCFHFNCFHSITFYQLESIFIVEPKTCDKLLVEENQRCRQHRFKISFNNKKVSLLLSFLHLVNFLKFNLLDSLFLYQTYQALISFFVVLFYFYETTPSRWKLPHKFLLFFRQK